MTETYGKPSQQDAVTSTPVPASQILLMFHELRCDGVSFSIIAVAQNTSGQGT
jgi:hypothetical protein